MKKFILLLALLCVHNNYSQSVQIKNVFVNNISIPVGGSINFGSNLSITVRFTSEFTKPNNLTIGEVQHSIGTYSNSGSYMPLITPEFFTLGINNTGFTGTWEKTLYASDYSLTGGNYLASRVEQTTGNQGNPPIIWNSNQVVINRSPIFTLNPTSLSLPCGNTSSQTFTVTNSGIPPGTSVSYNWFTGTGGWSGTLNNTNTITLIPISGTILPSDVSVIPVFNGVNLTTIICSVTRASFSSSAAISGTTNICSGSSAYAISNIIAGQTVSWSLSNPSIGTLSNQTNAGATVTFNGNGSQTLTATITNACNQTITKTFLINSGSTTFTSAAAISGSASFCSGSNVYNISGILAGQTVTWSLSNTAIASLSGTTNTQTTVNFTGSGSQTLTALITNSCGQTATKTFQIYGGVPTLSSFTCGIGATFCSGTVCFCDSCLPSLDPSSLLTANMNGLTGIEAGQASNWQWMKLNNNIQITTNKQKCYIAGTTLGASGVQVRARNSCGWSQWYTLNLNVVSCNRMAAVNSNIYTISPNPAKDVVNIELKEKNNKPIKEAAISGELFDIMGNSKSKVEILNNKATFSVAGLIKGIYVLKIYINNQEEIHQIAVE